MRASMLEVINADYVRTARAKGLNERQVDLASRLPQRPDSVVTLAAIDFGTLFGGAIVTETVFALDGMGRYFISSLNAGETYSIMAWMLVVSTMIVFFNLLADIALRRPRPEDPP